MKSTIKLQVDRAGGTVEFIGRGDSLIAMANRFLSSLKTRGLAFYTMRAYGYDLVNLFRWLETGSKTFRSLDQMKMLDWVAAQRRADAEPTTINRRLQTCYLFYRFCFNKNIKSHIGLFKRPSRYNSQGYNSLGLKFVRRPREALLKVRAPKKLIEVLEPDDIRKFLEEFSRYRDLAIIILMLMCGLRSCEVLALRSDDVDFYQRAIRVRGKGGRQRMLPLVETVSDLLRRYMRFERPRESRKRELFLVLQGSHRGQPMTPAGLRNLFRHRRIKTQIEKANPHRFRHCFGTEMARQGVQLPVLQKMLGHADAQMTLRYIQLSMADVALEYERAIQQIQSRYAKI